MEETWNIAKILKWSEGFLTKNLSDSPRLDAELLLAQVLKCERISLYLNYDRPLSSQERSLYKELLIRRGQGEPVAYILGKKEFWRSTFKVTPDVLIPRPETEVLVEEIIDLHTRERASTAGSRLLDVGTGSGCIVISLAQSIDNLDCVAWDISTKALAIAQMNADSCLGENAKRVRFEERDALEPASWQTSDSFDYIVSNPPYIADGEGPSLGRSVVGFEPKEALFAREDGLAFYKVLAFLAKDLLRQGGVLGLEIGSSQSAPVCELLARYSWNDIVIKKDYAGHDRCILARK